jgi:hypothetical protein
MVARAGMLSWLLAVGGIGGMAAGAIASAINFYLYSFIVFVPLQA